MKGADGWGGDRDGDRGGDRDGGRDGGRGGASLTHGGLGAIILGTFFLSLPTF